MARTTTPSLRRAPAPAEPGRQEPARPEPGRPEPSPDLRVVPRARRRRAGLVAVAASVVVFGVMLGLVAFQAKIAADQARLDRVERDLNGAQATYERLRLAVAQLESPQTVISAAKDKGMVVPDHVTYVTPSVADVLAVALAQGRSAAEPHVAASGDQTSGWAAIKPLVGGGTP